MNRASIMDLNDPVARNIEALIEAKGLKKKFVAERADIPERRFNDMLRGRCIMKAKHIANIADALEVTPDKLFAAPEKLYS